MPFFIFLEGEDEASLFPHYAHTETYLNCCGILSGGKLQSQTVPVIILGLKF